MFCIVTVVSENYSHLKGKTFKALKGSEFTYIIDSSGNHICLPNRDIAIIKYIEDNENAQSMSLLDVIGAKPQRLTVEF